MSAPAPAPPPAALTRLSGRYVLFHTGTPCGEERWRIEGRAGGMVVSGEHELVPPHPLPSRHAYRATLSPAWRITGLEVLWSVGTRELRATHAAEGGTWRVRIEYGGQAREQQGDFPDFCEVDFATPLFNTLILARRDFQIGGEHEFPVLRIGPPLMAVTPDRLLYRCLEKGRFDSSFGPLAAGRYEVTLPSHPDEEGYAFWADESGIVLESCEGRDPSRPWMRLVEYRRESA